MTYSKPQVLDTRIAQECIKGMDKQTDLDDNHRIGVQGTAAAYESDE
jgi:hypothetical protein